MFLRWGGSEFQNRGAECSEETDRCMEEEYLRQQERKLAGLVLNGPKKEEKCQ